MTMQPPWGPPPRSSLAAVLFVAASVALMLLSIAHVFSFGFAVYVFIALAIWYSLHVRRKNVEFNERRAAEWSQAPNPPAPLADPAGDALQYPPPYPQPYQHNSSSRRSNQGVSAFAIVLSVIAALGGLAMMGILVLVVLIGSSGKLFPNK